MCVVTRQAYLKYKVHDGEKKLGKTQLNRVEKYEAPPKNQKKARKEESKQKNVNNVKDVQHFEREEGIHRTHQWVDSTAENAPASTASCLTSSISAGVSVAKTLTPTTTCMGTTRLGGVCVRDLGVCDLLLRLT